ncbi:5089_t:CDS:2, partial [Scutellospora calospora]
GYITKIYDDNTTLHIVGNSGLQVILTIKFQTTKLTSIYEAVIRRVKEKQKIERGSILFLVVHQRQISSVAVMIPWQPLLLGKVNKLPRLGKDFASLYYPEKAEKLMQEDMNRLEINLKKIRSNQISLEAIEELFVEQQGKKEKIKQLATLKTNPERQLVIQVFEPKKTSVINKAVLEAQLGYQQ